jgi:hypothetical protein
MWEQKMKDDAIQARAITAAEPQFVRALAAAVEKVGACQHSVLVLTPSSTPYKPLFNA